MYIIYILYIDFSEADNRETDGNDEETKGYSDDDDYITEEELSCSESLILYLVSSCLSLFLLKCDLCCILQLSSFTNFRIDRA